MRSVSDDRTARAVIRDEALRLFAERGADAVTVRQIAAAAGVSAGLVVHHFGSKAGLLEAVDQHVLGLFDAMLAELSAGSGADPLAPESSGSLAEAVTRHLPADSPIPAYLRRLLLDGGDAGRQLFRRLFTASQAALDALSAAGLAARGPDPLVRAAFLMANDLAVLLLRDHLADVLGTDPLSTDGMTRWTAEVLTVYTAGLLPPHPTEPEEGIQ
ncbi:TetR/AcrR family transcriptional regulator [Streptacidiphilus carbonis]|uniref:TetR/AcrR family transcriptional regulator n=1 Tax=Streptacidiphilus carbonis TaxID=105422 RepID=UPI0005AB0D10|nr:TetR/AcrR family transcriptional regulator [Streptacidiphilus carbonis]